MCCVQVHSGALVTLPIRVDPIPGESLVSWLAAYATRMKCWWGEVLQIVLPASADLGRPDRDLVLVAHLRDDERDHIAAATHTDAAAIESMTLTGRYGQPLITIDPAGGRPHTPWGKISRHRFCPHCVKADPGRGRLEWLLPWITICPDHRCHLADACTDDGHHQCLSPTWFRLLEQPLVDRCCGLIHTPSGSSRGDRCPARLSKAPVQKVQRSDPFLCAQQTLTDWLSRPQVDRGLYTAAPVRPDELLQDILLLGGWLLTGADSADLLRLWGQRVTEQRINYWDNALRVQQAGHDNSKKSARVAAAPAPVVSAWVTAAMQILTKPSIPQAADALRTADRMANRRATNRNYPLANRGSTALAAADVKSRARSVNVFTELNNCIGREFSHKDRVEALEGDAMLRAIRSGLWTPWCQALDTGILSWTMHCQTMTRLLLAMGSTMAGHEANRRLHIHPSAHRVIDSSARRLYMHPQWTVIQEALQRLSRYLSATPPPIDYQRRRDLDYRPLLNDRQWNQLLASHDLPLPAGRDGSTPVLQWLTEQLSGPPARYVDGKLMRRDGPQDVLRAHLSLESLATLDVIAAEFLRSCGITDEPLRWTPPSTLLDGLDLPEITSPAEEPVQIHELIARGYTVVRASHALELPIETVRYHLEQHPRAHHTMPGPKPVPTPARDWLRTVLPEPKLRELYERRQLTRHTIIGIISTEHGRTVDRRTLESLMQEYNIEQRPIPRPTADWIHAEHIVGRRMLTDMAADLGVSPATLANYARRYGIPTHRYGWRFDQDPRSLQVLDALAINPEDRNPRLVSSQTWNDLQILVATSRYTSFSAAARALDRSECAISAHIGALEKAFGHQVCSRATSKRPITLTDFGQKLVRLTTAINRTAGHSASRTDATHAEQTDTDDRLRNLRRRRLRGSSDAVRRIT